LIEARLSIEEGKLYQEVEIPRRAYKDVEAEMANCLSILPNFEAWCRLIQVPETPGGRPKLAEHHIVTENLTEGKNDPEIAKQIKKNSRQLAKPKKMVEENIIRRSLGEIKVAQIFQMQRR
jgi:hypothetical protein